MDDHRASVFNEVNKERTRQDAKWGGAEHDDQHAAAQFGDFIIERMCRPEFVDDPRKAFVQAAALAVAAIESWDRRT